MNSNVEVISPQGQLTPYGPRASRKRFRVVGIFQTGFFEVDDKWAFTAIGPEQRMLSIGDEVNQIELNVDDPQVRTTEPLPTFAPAVTLPPAGTRDDPPPPPEWL